MKNETFHVISNTHWDREWYQCHEKYLCRLVELMDRLIDIMNNHKDYRFITDGQFALIDDYLAAKPEMKDEIKKLISEGRLLTGPWYTQPLENIVGGEALVRNLKKGISKSEALGGAMRFSYEIDEFGHTSQLPQILTGFGIHDVMAWRGVPDGCRSYFLWKGPDGTEVNFFNSNAGYGEATSLPSTENDFIEVIDGVEHKREGLISHINRIRDLRFNVSDSSHMVWLNGIDHSWAQEDIIEVCEKAQKLFPDYEIKQSTPMEYSMAVVDDLKKKNITPTTAYGELMFNTEAVLESTNSLHYRQKRRHYETEKLLVRNTEPLTAISHILGAKYPSWAVDRAWGYVLENHAHDSLGCCSVDEVYEQVMARYGASIALCEQINSESFRYIMSCGNEEPSLWLFNFSETPVSGAIKVTFDVPAGFGGENIGLETPDGKKVELDVISVKTNGDVRYNPRLGHPTWGYVAHFEAYINADFIPAFGALRLKVVKSSKNEATHRQDSYLVTAPGTMENEYIKVSINSNGSFDLTDKMNGVVYPSQMIFTDDGESGHCYIHEEPKNDKRRFSTISKSAEICTKYDTPLGASFEIKTVIDIPAGITPDRKNRTAETKPLEISSILELGKNDKSLGIKIHINNKSKNHRVRVLFPSYIEDASTSMSGQAFDEVVRDIKVPVTASGKELMYATKPMQDFCSVYGNNNGLAVSARGLYEYECIDDKAKSLALTLFRSIEVIDNDTFECTPEYFMHEAQNICEMDFSLNLIPYDGNKETLLKEVKKSLSPITALINRATEDSVMPGYIRPECVIGDTFKAVEIEGDSLEITSFRISENCKSLNVRVRNRGNKISQGKLNVSIPSFCCKSVNETDLEGNILNNIGCGNSVDITINPSQLKTFEFSL